MPRPLSRSPGAATYVLRARTLVRMPLAVYTVADAYRDVRSVDVRASPYRSSHLAIRAAVRTIRVLVAALKHWWREDAVANRGHSLDAGASGGERGGACGTRVTRDDQWLDSGGATAGGRISEIARDRGGTHEGAIGAGRREEQGPSRKWCEYENVHAHAWARARVRHRLCGDAVCDAGVATVAIRATDDVGALRPLDRKGAYVGECVRGRERGGAAVMILGE
ncbi:predicted protein [Postia placenta Mad-698-R]|uniref:Uncharacterized protein n=1 Tax=Postia placenta MAD-698-R-SB12 TaxID=670580 RepID=A0A1X6MI33_9APHY|nr:hypothetical protein POSPLADRAFT_1161442 [Postia placenta MAD-698-R-SB12]EED79949.1 predicted protein [Postia placenta Mad-698-R]OSX56020.1 hypothetical protein POSPLADRAFT_1161442 [Postia placenta MAD-698-R-SB12]